MTVNEIIKALDDALHLEDSPIGMYWGCFLTKQQVKDAIDLIHRLLAEIERLQKQARLDDEYIKSLEKAFNDRTAELQTAKFDVKQLNIDVKRIENRRITDCRYWQKKYFALKAEAIKEFAERLKENKIDIDVSFGYGREVYTEAVAVIEIDNLVQEMVGDSNAK